MQVFYKNFTSFLRAKLYVLMNEKLKNLKKALVSRGEVTTSADFAEKIGVDEGTMSKMFSGKIELSPLRVDQITKAFPEVDRLYLLDANYDRMFLSDPSGAAGYDTVLVLPYGARGGTIADFADSVHAYDCERLISPIKGADYAMEVTGDSMSPEYPSGSRVIIKKVNEAIFVEWGKVYVLDTENGALIKQVRRTQDPGVVECVSLNPAYQPFTLNTEYIHGWYRVMMVMSLK